MSKYIGARYVPLMMGEWNSEIQYDPLSVVIYQGNSYTSKKNVPNGVDITNETYWVKTGDFNQQLANLESAWDEFQEMHSNIYVTPQMYGADGNGVTDDTEAIRQAIASGKSVYFPAGTYKVLFGSEANEILFPVKSNQMIELNEKAIISIANETLQSLQAVFGCTSFPVDNVTIKGGTIEALALHETNAMGVRLETPRDYNSNAITNFNISNITFKNLDSAVYIVQRRSTGVDNRQIKNVTISECVGINCLSSFVTADGMNITIKNCIADGGNNANAYDAVSVHSGMGIKILNNTFFGYTTGQVINIRNSPENMCGSKDVIVQGNTIRDCACRAMQISLQAGEETYGCTNVIIDSNIVDNCTSAIMITSGDTHNTPFHHFSVTNNMFRNCPTGGFRVRNTVNEIVRYVEISNNNIENCGVCDVSQMRQSVISGNNVHLNDTARIEIDHLYYCSVVGNEFWTNNTGIDFTDISNSNIRNNFLRGVSTLTNFSASDFANNMSMSLITIGILAGLNLKTDYIHGNIITYGNSRPTGSQPFTKGDIYYNTEPNSNNIFAWVCTESGNPGTWKAINLS